MFLSVRYRGGARRYIRVGMGLRVEDVGEEGESEVRICFGESREVRCLTAKQSIKPVIDLITSILQLQDTHPLNTSNAFSSSTVNRAPATI
jgi:hypothetical protein